MLTHLIDFTPDQLTAAVYAFNDRAGALLKAIRDAMDSDFLTVGQLRDKVRTDLQFLRPTLAALSKVSPMLGDERLTELDALMGEYHTTLAEREQDEAEYEAKLAAWRARVAAQRKTVACEATAG
ncbi:MAG: hypothetical protein ACYC5Y_04970 [Symbiobacteriia bacterium]